jgi:alpha-ketoglutarate-dependent taurine dioxygenase
MDCGIPFCHNGCPVNNIIPDWNDLVYRHKWREGDLLMWDNRATWHHALNDYHGERRLMHRVTLEGVALEGS